ncbi:MAG: hypothetical protein GF355_02505, partial [Candidatus Eisenbacteria bacterium]|nr:hypothetical protein [Candidatus Eisenbacteria bacterium]
LEILRLTARRDELTGAEANPDFGYGRVDALAATEEATPVLLAGLAIRSETWGVTLSWRLLGGLSPDAVLVWRAADDGSPPDQLWREAKRVARTTPAGPEMTWNDHHLPQPGRYAYWIQAEFQGNREPRTGPVEVAWTGRSSVRLEFFPPTPNPFHPQAFLRIHLPQPGTVVVQILDPAGRRVRTLVETWLTPGDHLLPWDGRTDAGGPAPAGLYFARVKANGEERVGRLVLIR